VSIDRPPRSTELEPRDVVVRARLKSKLFTVARRSHSFDERPRGCILPGIVMVGRPPIYGTVASARIAIRITPEQRRGLAQLAHREAAPIASVVRELIDERLERLTHPGDDDDDDAA
jgi:hypothetical protein